MGFFKKLGQGIKNTVKKVGQKVAPVVKKVGKFVANKVVPIVAKYGDKAAAALLAIPGLEEFAPAVEGLTKGAQAYQAGRGIYHGVKEGNLGKVVGGVTGAVAVKNKSANKADEKLAALFKKK